VVLIANPVDGFIAFIGIQPIKFWWHRPERVNIVSNGIEQCAFKSSGWKVLAQHPEHRAGNSPPPAPSSGFSGEAPFHVEQVFDFSKAPLNSLGCGGATGMAVGPDHQIGLACGGTNTLVIDDRTGNAVSGGS
jgi:hypothetical protein